VAKSKKRQTPTSSSRPKCYIAAAETSLRSKVTNLLDERGTEVLHLEGQQGGSLSLQARLWDAIKCADFVVALLGSPSPAPNTMLEIGLAIGLGKPVLLMLTSADVRLPTDLSGLLHFVIEEKPDETIAFALDNFLNQIGRSASPRKKKTSTGAPLGRKAADILQRIESLRKERQAQQNVRVRSATYAFAVEELVRDIIDGCQLPVMSQSSKNRRQADFAIWLDELNALFGNPLIVEVKGYSITRKHLAQISRQLVPIMDSIGSRGAVVLYLGDEKQPASLLPVDRGVLLLIELETLVRRLQKQTLGETLRQLRNEATHSGGF